MGKSLLTEDKQKNPGEFTWGLPVLKILLVRGSVTLCHSHSVKRYWSTLVCYQVHTVIYVHTYLGLPGVAYMYVCTYNFWG